MSIWVLIIVALVPYRDAYVVTANFTTEKDCVAAMMQEREVERQINADKPNDPPYVQWSIVCKEIKR